MKLSRGITRYALGARGIDRIEKVVDSTSSSPTTVTQYPLYDAHGNMVATLSKGSSAGTYTVGNQRAFEPWGSVFDSSGLSNTPKQADCASLGHVADSELGLTYMRARYYEPGTGRFISEDPACDGQNWFSYCDNIPSYHDLSGRSRLFGFQLEMTINLAAAYASGNISSVVLILEVMSGTELSATTVAALAAGMGAARKVSQSASGLEVGEGHLTKLVEHLRDVEGYLLKDPNANVDSVLREITAFLQNWAKDIKR